MQFLTRNPILRSQLIHSAVRGQTIEKANPVNFEQKTLCIALHFFLPFSCNFPTETRIYRKDGEIQVYSSTGTEKYSCAVLLELQKLTKPYKSLQKPTTPLTKQRFVVCCWDIFGKLLGADRNIYRKRTRWDLIMHGTFRQIPFVNGLRYGLHTQKQKEKNSKLLGGFRDVLGRFLGRVFWGYFREYWGKFWGGF